MPVTGFIEMVRNERSMFAPLAVDRPTNRIRRALFQGKLVGTDEFSSDYFGGSSALINQVCAEMERWGFEFERIKGADGRKGFKLANPMHQPVEKTPRVPGPPRQRKAAKARPGEQRGDLRKAIREALIAGEAMSAKDCMAKFDCTEGNLRVVVRNMVKEGHAFDEYAGKTGKTYVLRRNSKAMTQERTERNGSNGHGNSRLPVLAFPPGETHNGELAIPPLPMFGAHVQMVGQFLTPDGEVNLMFRDDDGDQWLTSIEGHSVVGPTKGH